MQLTGQRKDFPTRFSHDSCLVCNAEFRPRCSPMREFLRIIARSARFFVSFFLRDLQRGFSVVTLHVYIFGRALARREQSPEADSTASVTRAIKARIACHRDRARCNVYPHLEHKIIRVETERVLISRTRYHPSRDAPKGRIANRESARSPRSSSGRDIGPPRSLACLAVT